MGRSQTHRREMEVSVYVYWNEDIIKYEIKCNAQKSLLFRTKFNTKIQEYGLVINKYL